MRVVVIGGGWAGAAAALQARKLGAEVVLLEKTDMLLGLGNVGGIMRNNGRFTAAEEMIALGAGELFALTDSCTLHANLDFPGHKHAWVYSVIKVEPAARKLLQEKGIEVRMQSRVVDIEFSDEMIHGVYLADGEYIKGDVFIESTGSTGPTGNCIKYGNGCAMCILRCPTFGPRISISAMLGVKDLVGLNGYLKEGHGAMSGACKLCMESLSEELQRKLKKDGVLIVKVPGAKVDMGKLKSKVCQQYALKEFAENLVLIDTGYAKLMTSYYPLEQLRTIPGFEQARYDDPYSGGKTNSIRYMSMAPRDDHMQVIGIKNLFCAGEKAGLFVGHTEAICTGTLAGFNAIMLSKGLEPIAIPMDLAVGDLIAYENKMKDTIEGLSNRYTFAGASYFNRMKERDLYTTDLEIIQQRVKKLGFSQRFASA